MKFREYSQLYVATDGFYSKIGVTDNVRTRQPKAIRPGALPSIVKHWDREDAAHLEKFMVMSLRYLCVSGQEWFSVPANDLVAAVEDQIWYVETGKAMNARRPIPFNLQEIKVTPISDMLNAGETKAATCKAVKCSVTTINNYFEFAGRPKAWRLRKPKPKK